MRIGLVTMLYNKRTGIGRCVAELAERLAPYHEVHVFMGGGEVSPAHQITFHRIPLAVSSLSWTLRELSFFFMSGFLLRRWRFDVLHVHAPTACACDVVTTHGIPRAAIRLLKHSGRFSERLDVPARLVLRYSVLRPLLEYNFYPGRYRKVIAISASTRKELVECLCVPGKDIVYIPNGVDLDEFHPRQRDRFRKEIRVRFGFKESDFVVLFVGSFYRNKGLAFVLEALARLQDDDIKLLVVGRDRIELVRFVDRAREMGVSDRVTFAGEALREVSRYYAASDLFVFPTFYESFALVLLEAMASGLPVVMSKAGAAPDIIQDGVNGLLLGNLTDASEIATKIMMLKRSPALREQLGRNAREAAEQYSWDRMAQQTERLYEGIVESKKRLNWPPARDA